MAKLSIRIDFTGDRRLGPGKILLLENIAKLGSISAAGRAMDMSYRRAWLLVAELNGLFREPLVTAQMGGRRGGGAELTPVGADIVAHYRGLEAALAGKVGRELRAVEALLAEQRRAPRRPRQTKKREAPSAPPSRSSTKSRRVGG